MGSGTDVGKGDVEAPGPAPCPYDVTPEALNAMNEVNTAPAHLPLVPSHGSASGKRRVAIRVVNPAHPSGAPLREKIHQRSRPPAGRPASPRSCSATCTRGSTPKQRDWPASRRTATPTARTRSKKHPRSRSSSWCGRTCRTPSSSSCVRRRRCVSKPTGSGGRAQHPVRHHQHTHPLSQVRLAPAGVDRAGSSDQGGARAPGMDRRSGHLGGHLHCRLCQ